MDSEYFKVRLRHLNSTLYKVHNKIVEYGQANRAYDDMGTTLSVMVLIKSRALMAHVGGQQNLQVAPGSFRAVD